jgi:hypothetical protein
MQSPFIAQLGFNDKGILHGKDKVAAYWKKALEKCVHDRWRLFPELEPNLVCAWLLQEHDAQVRAFARLRRRKQHHHSMCARVHSVLCVTVVMVCRCGTVGC